MTGPCRGLQSSPAAETPAPPIVAAVGWGINDRELDEMRISKEKVVRPELAGRYNAGMWKKLVAIARTLVGRKPMDKARIPHPNNAPGPFYVEKDCCVSCDAPRLEAPDLIGTDDQEYGYHCYFRRQPETSDEIERAIRACAVSCVRAVRYAGGNPRILKRLRDLNSEDSSDFTTS